MKNISRMKKLRETEEYKEMENEKNLGKMKSLRKLSAYKYFEQEKNRERIKELRNDENFKVTEQNKAMVLQRDRRNIDILQYREYFYNSLRRKNTNKTNLMLQFIKFRADIPENVCCSCEGLFFSHSTVLANKTKLIKNRNEDFTRKVFNCESMYICKTCNNNIMLGKIPKFSTSNNLKFPKVPDCLSVLSPLEERMVAPYIPFMQIRPLKSFFLKPQLGIKGSVINIPIEVSDIIKVLPRKFNNMSTIQIKLKRHIQHKSNYMFETVRPGVICDALKFLINTSLYKKHNIQIDQSFFSQFEACTDEVECILDEDDFFDEYSCENKNLKDLVNDVEDDLNIEDEERADDVLLVNRDAQVTDSIKVIAPGQGQKPVPWHLIEDVEELCFPKIFAGREMKTPKAITYSIRAKSEARRKDRRSCVPERILFMAKKKLEMACLANMNICLRKSKKENLNYTAKSMRNPEFINNVIKFDYGYKFLKQIRSSPPYWENKKRDLMAMLRQLGKPTFFLTLSAAETRWPELVKFLFKLKFGKSISNKEALLMEQCEKLELIRNDPVSCARYFDYKVNKMMWLLKQNDSIFEKYVVEDSYERIEFQNRGSPHEHIFLWLKDAPKLDESNENSIRQCINFIDQFITCEYIEENPYMVVLWHKHSYTCYKGKKNKGQCRFNYPLPVMPKTAILYPIDNEDITDEVRNNFKEIKNLMIYLYKKRHEIMEFNEILEKLNMSEENYIKAIRSSITRVQVFLKRNSQEVGLNCYNKNILSLFESNMDLQFICEEYALASYIINYVGKIESGLSKLLRDAADDMKQGNDNIKNKLRNITNVFLNSNLMSAQEAAYHVLTLPLSKNSRQVIFINTNKSCDRVLMLKSHKDLCKLDEDSTEIYMPNLIDKYTKREEKFNDTCLADYTAYYNKKSRSVKNDSDNEDIHDNEILSKRQKPAVIRYVRYKLIQDPYNYYREQLLLFLPFRNELAEIENIDPEAKYLANKELIERNKVKYSIINDEKLESAIEEVHHHLQNIEDTDVENFVNDQLSPENRVDIFEQMGETTNDPKINRFSIPVKIPFEELSLNLRKLNDKQREIVLYVLHKIKIGQEALRLYLSGSAGVGKSLVINSLYQLISHYFQNQPGADKDSIYVLLCAPSGKAAFIIHGVTLHTAFALPVSQFAGLMPELSNDLANTIRAKLSSLKLLIIDEISMVGSTLFKRVDERLKQIMGTNKSFGGVSVIVVGDLNQLPPVMDSPIYKVPKINHLSEILSGLRNPLWEEFNFYELTEIMRQKNEIKFINALNNLAIGKMTKDDIVLLNTRVVSEDDVPLTAIRLFADNANVDKFNAWRIENFPGEEFESEANDFILGKINENTKIRVLESLKSKKKSELNGLSHKIKLKTGLKYMLTCNIDVEDGLVNGATGTLKFITFKSNTKEPNKLWLDFQSKSVGKKQRLLFSEFIRKTKINPDLTPIEKSSVTLNISKKLQFPVIRKQFPVVLAEAITIHKSQGQTYDKICIDFCKSSRLSRKMMYVALSRVTALSGLYILGSFPSPKTSKSENETLNEITYLRSEKRVEIEYDVIKKDHGIKIIYHNIQSWQKNGKNIIVDQWYSNGDVLIFAETLVKVNDVINFPGFECFFRTNSSLNSRGMLGFIKRKDNWKYHVDIISKEVRNGHVELVFFQLNNYKVISGYKSPRVPNVIFTEVFNMLYKKNVKQHEKLIVMGDFNFDIYNDDKNKSFLKNFFDSYKLQSKLPLDRSTTNFNTQIDVIFATLSDVITGEYESYFSDHKPIYCILDQINDTAEKNLVLQEGNINGNNNEREIDLLNISMGEKDKGRILNNIELEKKKEIKIHKDKPENITFNGKKKKVFNTETSGKTSNELMQFNLTVEKKNEFLQAGYYLSDDDINLFHSIVEKSTNYKPQLPNLICFTNLIEAIDRNSKHLQILYDPTNEQEELFWGQSNKKNINNYYDGQVGHWICSYYDGICVHIYDSLKTENLRIGVKKYLEKLYPFTPIVQSHNVQQQTNYYDCGVFAIAFATSVCLGENPEDQTYDISRMRRHCFQILTAETLISFPKIMQ